MLGEGFRHAERVGIVAPATDSAPDSEAAEVSKYRPKGPRRVRTIRGMKVFGQPIGTIITRDMIERAKRAGKLKGADAAHYDAPNKPAPVRGAKAPAKAARAGARAATKVSAPRAKAPAAPARGKGGDGFEERLKRASYKDVRSMIVDLQNDDQIDDATFDKRLDALLARGRQLRPNKDHGSQTKREAAKPPAKPAPKKVADAAAAPSRAVRNGSKVPSNQDPVTDMAAPSATQRARAKAAHDREKPKKPRTDFGQGPAYDPADQHAQDVLGDFVDAISGARNEQELDIITRYLGKEKGLHRQERADIVARIQSKRKTLKPSQVNPTADAPKAAAKKPDPQPSGESPDAAFMRMRSSIAQFHNDASGGGRPERIKQEADRLRAMVTDPKVPLTAPMRNLLVEQIAEAEKGGKAKRSPRYDHFADEIMNATTAHDLAIASQDIRDDMTLPKPEAARLIEQIIEQSKALGVDQRTLLQPGTALNPAEWDTHPTKVKPVKSVPLDGNGIAYLRSGRKELAVRAEEIRAKERRDNPDLTPAGKEVLAGKALDEVKNPAGLVEFIDAHPERFSKSFTTSGQGGAFTVKDKASGREFFFKHTNAGTVEGSKGTNVKMFGEAVNEVMSGKIGQAFPDWFPNVDFAGAMESGANPTIRMDHLHETAKRMGDVKTVHFDSSHRWDENWDGDKILHAKARKVRDPKNPLAIHIFDYLTNSTDRHDENYGELVHEDGTVTLVALDNGAAFHGFDSFIAPMLPKHFVSAPESVGYAEFAATFTSGSEWYVGTSRGKFMANETVAGYKAHGGDAKTIQKDAEAIIKRFSEMSPEQIQAELLRRFPDMQNYERAHLTSAAHIFQSRLKNISARDVATFMTKWQQATEGQDY